MIGDPTQGFPGDPGGQYKINNIYDVSPLFLGDLAAYFTANPNPVPIAQITGFTQITPYNDAVKTSESTTSTTFVDLTTVGPQVQSVPDGTYVTLYGASMSNSSAVTRSRMAPSVNSAAPDATLQAFTLSGAAVASGVFATILTLNAGGSNSIVMQYSTGAGGTTAMFESRWLVAIRIAGP